MSTYDLFLNSKIGEKFSLINEFGWYDFIKIGEHLFSIVFSAKNSNAFCFTRFSCVVPVIEASCLYDKQKDVCDGKL